MSDNVVSVFGGPVGELEPDASCIDCLERWLEMARSGKIVGIAIAGVSHDNLSEYALTGRIGGFGIIGAMQMLQQHLVDINMEVE
jgi:hypothetical protein